MNSGRVRTYKINDDAKEYSVAINGPGDFIGYLSVLEGDRYMESAESMDDVEILKKKLTETLNNLDNLSPRDINNNNIKKDVNNILEEVQKSLSKKI